MGSVWRDTRPRSDGRPVYVVSWKDENGKWRQKSVQATCKEQASIELRRIEDDVLKTKSLGLQSPEQLKPVTFEKFVDDEYLPAKAPPATRESSYRREKQLFANVKDFFGSMVLRSINVGVVERYFSKRKNGETYRDKPPSPAQMNRERSFLSCVFKMARKHGILEKNPVEDVDKFDEDNTKDRVISLDEQRDILAKSPAFLRPIVSLAIATGMREGELVDLRWSDVDRDNGYIRVGQDSKTHKARQVPITDAAEAVLDTLKPVRTEKGFLPWVFVNDRLEKPYKASSVYNAFKRAAFEASVEGVVFHTCRHTFCSRSIARGINPKAVQMALGHSSDHMVNRYLHLSPSDVRRAFAAAAPATSKVLQIAATER